MRFVPARNGGSEDIRCLARSTDRCETSRDVRRARLSLTCSDNLWVSVRAHHEPRRERDMPRTAFQRRSPIILIFSLAGVAASFGAASLTTSAPPGKYVPHNLVSDIPGLADVTDPNLVNPWGIVPN